MQNFEELIKDYYVKVVNKDNPQIYTFEPLVVFKRKRTRTVKFERRIVGIPRSNYVTPGVPPEFCSKNSNGKPKSVRIKTPDGIFANVQAAADYYEISTREVHGHCQYWTIQDFFYYHKE